MSMIKIEAGMPVNLADSGYICHAAGEIIGYYVNSATSPVINVVDGGNAGDPLPLPDPVTGDMTPTAGFQRFPMRINSSTGAFMNLYSGAINITWFFIPAENVI